MRSRQPACGAGVPEGPLQAERLQRPTDPQSPQPSPEHQSARRLKLRPRLSHLPTICRDYSAECRPGTPSNQCPASQECIYFPPACQRWLRTKDTGCMQNPLWVRQGLHWADMPFRGYQVERASAAYTSWTSRQISRSWTHRRLGTPHSISQNFRPRH
jgi:hypothetical protein